MVSIIISVLSGFAEMERNTIRQRSISGIRHQVSQGGSGTGKFKAYGFSNQNKKLVIEPEEAKIVELIFDKYLSGLGCLAIANYLNSENVPTKFQLLFDANHEIKLPNYKKKLMTSLGETALSTPF